MVEIDWKGILEFLWPGMTYNMIFNDILSEIFFIICGLFFIATGAKALRDMGCPKYKTTSAFWFLIGTCFLVGRYIPSWLTGFILCGVAVISAMGGISKTRTVPITLEDSRTHADRIGGWIFIPSIILAFSAVILASINVFSAGNAIGVAAIIAAVVTLLVTKAPADSIIPETAKKLDAMGTTLFIPQLLAALGSLFAICGVDVLISKFARGIIPNGSKLIAVVVYCLGMALFTAVMGNAFAAFAVMTMGVGIPFLVNQGANPVIVGSLGMTAGFCGSLITPMAADTNIATATLLETKNKYAVIKAQLPVAAILMVFHIVAMYILAF